MRLTRDEVEAALYVVHDLVYRRRLAGRSIPTEVAALYRRLLVTSSDGTKSHVPPEELDANDLIDTTAAAEILGCSTRWVREIRCDLDGQNCGGRWLFRRQTVVEYAALKGVGGGGNRVPADGRRAISA